MRRSGNIACRLATVVIAAALLQGCSRAVTIEAEFPQPLIQPLPLQVGLRYDETFANYVFAEELTNDFDWRFDIGSANQRLFDTIFGAMFEGITRVEDLDSVAEQFPQIHAVIVPEIEAMEYSVPRQSQNNQYSVWIRYNLHVYEPNGDLITKWPVSAYGQSDSRAFNAEESMRRATLTAMRDAAASITLGFSGQPKIKQALLSQDDDNET